MSVSPPMPSPDQREATIPDRGLLASVAFLVVLGPFTIPVDWFLNSLCQRPADRTLRHG
jgi:hypothetical protein